MRGDLLKSTPFRMTVAVPWGYLALLIVAAIAANGLASMNAMRQSRIDPAQRLRELQ